jgi:hypothetical protein
VCPLASWHQSTTQGTRPSLDPITLPPTTTVKSFWPRTRNLAPASHFSSILVCSTNTATFPSSSFYLLTTRERVVLLCGNKPNILFATPPNERCHNVRRASERGREERECYNQSVTQPKKMCSALPVSQPSSFLGPTDAAPLGPLSALWCPAIGGARETTTVDTKGRGMGPKPRMQTEYQRRKMKLTMLSDRSRSGRSRSSSSVLKQPGEMEPP